MHQPPQIGNAVRWHYAHDSMHWFRDQKGVFQICDINFGAKAQHEDVPYADNHKDYSERKVNAR